MRSVSFVDHLEFEFSGNILDRAIVLGDVDNDGSSELVVANVAGDLAIFKGETRQAWKEYHGLGMVVCVVIGDVCNIGDNVVFCITSEGWCHLLCFGQGKASGVSGESDERTTEGKNNFVSIYHQSLPTNSKVAVLADIDRDGENELVIASTDRVVRVFKWVNELPDKESEDIHSKGKCLVKQDSKEGKSSMQKQNSKESKGSSKQTQNIDHEDLSTIGDSSSQSTHSSSKIIPASSSFFQGRFVCTKRWKLLGHIESLSVVQGRSGTCPAILVSQPGGAYTYLVCVEESLKENLQKQTEQLKSQDSAICFADCHSTNETIRLQRPLPPRSDMSSIPTHVVSWSCKLVRGPSTSPTNFIAMCTLNGTLAVIRDEKMHWSINLNHNFFTVQKLDITGDGTEEIVFCALDGETYIMDRYENIVSFKFGEDISTFCAGTYALDGKRSLPCLVYVTFNNRIRLYWDVKMRLESRNFNDTVVAKLNEFNLEPKYMEFMMESEYGSLDNKRIKQLTRWCLYGGGRVKQLDS